MTIKELRWHGYVENNVPQFFGYCHACAHYTYFRWFINQDRREAVACRDCQTVERTHAEKIEQAEPVPVRARKAS